jgi:hypothetical protein
MVTKQQTMADGPSRVEQLSQKYANVPAHGIVLAHQLRMLLLGLVGVGKSYFCQSIPGGRIINMAKTPITNPNFDPEQTELWPLPGDPVALTWPIVEEKLKEWRSDSKCKVIVIDDYSEMARLTFEYAAFKLLGYSAKRASREDGGQTSAEAPSLEEMNPWLVRQAHGQTAYDLARGWINYEMASANSAGKGFIIPMHVDKEVVTLTDPKSKTETTFERWGPIATYKAMKRLYSPIDASFYITLEEREHQKKMSVSKEVIVKQYMVTKFDPLSDYLKPRTLTRLPSRFDVTNGWTQFEATYNEHAKGVSA